MTRKTRKAPWAVVLTALLAVLGMVFGVMTAAVPASADPDPTQVCAPLDSGKIDVSGEQLTVTITAPEGKLVTGYCVKAGSTQQGNGPVYVTLTTPVSSLEISHPSGKAISNYSFSLGTVPTYYYAGTGLASDSACTLVEEDEWAIVEFGPISVTGKTVAKDTEWSDADKAVEDAKAQSEAESLLAADMAKYTIDVTGANCQTSPPPVPGSQTFCVAPAGTTTFAYDTFGTTDNTKPQSTWTNGSGLPLSAYVVGTAADCTPTPPPPPPPPPTQPEPVTVVEPAIVAVPAPATVPVPAKVTLPATIPAGEGSTMPVYALALLVLGATALAATTVHLVRTTR